MRESSPAVREGEQGALGARPVLEGVEIDALDAASVVVEDAVPVDGERAVRDHRDLDGRVELLRRARRGSWPPRRRPPGASPCRLPRAREPRIEARLAQAAQPAARDGVEHREGGAGAVGERQRRRGPPRTSPPRARRATTAEAIPSSPATAPKAWSRPGGSSTSGALIASEARRTAGGRRLLGRAAVARAPLEAVERRADEPDHRRVRQRVLRRAVGQALDHRRVVGRAGGRELLRAGRSAAPAGRPSASPGARGAAAPSSRPASSRARGPPPCPRRRGARRSCPGAAEGRSSRRDDARGPRRGCTGRRRRAPRRRARHPRAGRRRATDR